MFIVFLQYTLQSHKCWGEKSGKESKKHNLQYVFDKPVTLKQDRGKDQDHQTKNDNVDPKQGFERPCLNVV